MGREAESTGEVKRASFVLDDAGDATFMHVTHHAGALFALDAPHRPRVFQDRRELLLASGPASVSLQLLVTAPPVALVEWLCGRRASLLTCRN